MPDEQTIAVLRRLFDGRRVLLTWDRDDYRALPEELPSYSEYERDNTNLDCCLYFNRLGKIRPNVADIPASFEMWIKESVTVQNAGFVASVIAPLIATAIGGRGYRTDVYLERDNGLTENVRFFLFQRFSASGGKLGNDDFGRGSGTWQGVLDFIESVFPADAERTESYTVDGARVRRVMGRAYVSENADSEKDAIESVWNALVEQKRAGTLHPSLPPRRGYIRNSFEE